MSTENQTENQSEKKGGFLDPKANLKVLIRIGVIILVLLGTLWLFVRFTAGEKAANRVTAAVLQRPIDLRDSVENVAAASWKGFPLSLPYTGTVTIEANVVKGNGLDVYVIEANQLESLKAKRQFTHLTDFEATKTKAFRRSARLKAGIYYFVAMDTSLGILSERSTDIQVKARLEP